MNDKLLTKYDLKDLQHSKDKKLLEVPYAISDIQRELREMEYRLTIRFVLIVVFCALFVLAFQVLVNRRNAHPSPKEVIEKTI